MASLYSSDDYSRHGFGFVFNTAPPWRAQFFWVLSRLRACTAMGTVILLTIALCSSIASAQQKTSDQTPPELVDLSLEQLMNVNIYTASKRWQKIVDAPASISIVSADEIQKYGNRRTHSNYCLDRSCFKGDRERCTAAGMDEYISKPIEAEALFEVIERATAGEVSANRKNRSHEPVFDANALGTNFDGDFELVRKLADIFTEASVGQLNQVREAIEIGDLQTLELVAHSLKGAVANFRAPAAVEAAARLESIGRSGDLSDADASFAVLEKEIERLNEGLATLVEVTLQ